MLKKLLFFTFFLFSTSFSAQSWNLPADSISDNNQDAMGANIAINSNDKAIAVWHRSNGSNYIIQTKDSSDGGSTWNVESLDLSQIGEDAYMPHVAMNNAKAVAVWERYNGAKYVIQTKYSTDNGINWSDNATDLSDSNQNANFPYIAMNSSTKAIAIWRKYNGSNYIIQSKYSTDGGATWSSTATDLSSTGKDSFIPQVVINDSDKAIAMWVTFDGSELTAQIKYSTDGGATWNASPIDISPSGGHALGCDISLNNSNEAIAIWPRYNGSNYIIQTKYSTDGGANWSASPIDLSATGNDSLISKVVINNLSKAIAIWIRNDGNNWIVQAKNSSDGGASWSSSATDLSSSGKTSWDPRLTLTDSNTAIVIWRRFSGTCWMVQTKDSSDAGSTWSSSATNLSTAGYDANQAEISINSSNLAIVTWPRYNGTNWIIQAVNN